MRGKLSREEKESDGGDKDQSEVEKLLEELMEISDESDRRPDHQSDAKREAVENEKKQAV